MIETRETDLHDNLLIEIPLDDHLRVVHGLETDLEVGALALDDLVGALQWARELGLDADSRFLLENATIKAIKSQFSRIQNTIEFLDIKKL